MRGLFYARIHPQAIAGNRTGAVDRRGAGVPHAAAHPRRPGGDPGGRRREQRADRRDPREPRPRPPAAGAVRHLDRQPGARRAGPVVLLQDAGHAAHRPAPRADDGARRAHHLFRGGGFDPAWRARRLALGGWFDRALMGFSVLGFSVPVFVLAYILIWIVSLQLGWFPVQGYRRLADGFFPFLHHLILPALTLSVIYIALIARVTRASVLEALGEDYVRTARAKGLPEIRVLVRHALANAAVPIATVIGIGIAILIGGVVVTESVYAIPGLGRLTVDAVLARDFPTIQGVILFFSFVYVLVNLLIDLSYVVLDPRIRY